jgi:transposase
MSCESGRRAPYASDLRYRIVWQRYGMDLQYRAIARNLSISLGTAYNICKRFEITGEVTPKLSCRTNTRILSSHDELIVIGILLNDPSQYLAEVCELISTMLGICISPSTVCRVLQRNGLTRKRIQQVALQRSDEYRGEFMAEMDFFDINQIVWLDETGCDRRDHLRKFGYALRGQRPVYHRLLHRGKRVSIVAAMCTDGVIALEFNDGTFNGDKFKDFLIGTLIPQMKQFDGRNERSVLVMDNCSIHYTSIVQEVLSDAGILTLFLPPYSPDFNPMEELLQHPSHSNYAT